jgi:hypothetical protein
MGWAGGRADLSRRVANASAHYAGSTPHIDRHVSMEKYRYIGFIQFEADLLTGSESTIYIVFDRLGGDRGMPFEGSKGRYLASLSVHYHVLIGDILNSRIAGKPAFEVWENGRAKFAVDALWNALDRLRLTSDRNNHQRQ